MFIKLLPTDYIDRIFCSLQKNVERMIFAVTLFLFLINFTLRFPSLPSFFLAMSAIPSKVCTCFKYYEHSEVKKIQSFVKPKFSNILVLTLVEFTQCQSLPLLLGTASPYYQEGLRFLKKKKQKAGSRFSCKNGGNPYRRGVSTAFCQ